jgi:hypothetical protein
VKRFILSTLCLTLFSTLPAYAQVAFDAGGPSGGAIILGASASACNATMEGAIHWDGTCFQGCDGSSWECINGACDNTPHPFVFTDVTAAATSTLFESNIVQINGADAGCNSVISISGDGSPEWRLCSNVTCGSEIQTWTSSNSSQDTQGNYVQIRATSDALTNVTNTVTANVGSASNVWTVATTITGSCGATPTFGDVCADGSVYAGITPNGNVPMYVPRCDVGMTWSGSVCTGTRSLLSWNDGNSAGRTFTGYSSSTTGELNSSGIITLDSDDITVGIQPHQAAQACADLNVHGNTDWYLPARSEMITIWDSLIEGTPNDENPDPIITGFATTSYWSSSESITSYAQRASFSSGPGGGTWYGTNKHSAYAVRCARKD